MAYLLLPGLLDAMNSPADVRKLMRKDLKNAAGKVGVKFVAAKNYKVGGTKPTHMFVVTDKTEPFEKLFKASNSMISTGAVAVDVDAGVTKIILRKVKGQLNADAIIDMMPKVFVDKKVVCTTVGAEKDAADKDKAATGSKPDPAQLASASHKRARDEGKIDWKAVSSAPNVERMAKLSYETAQYKKFADEFVGLAKKYKFKDYKKVPANIWRDLIKGLADSGYLKERIPKVGTTENFILAFAGPEGQVVRETMLGTAMKGLDKYIKHAETYLEKVVDAVKDAGPNPSWAFWSGTGAQDAARKEASRGVVLEGSIGSWFDNVWDFKPLTGVENLPLWAAMSELYAKKAAENYKTFNFVGFLGPGATRDQSVFNKIEQPTFLQILNVRERVAAPDVKWFVVDCEKDAQGRWAGTGNPSKEFASRAAGLREVTDRYGG